jgi:hypothetical protein
MLINALAQLAVSGSTAAAVCLLLRRMARGRLSARWEDRMVKLSLLFALVPWNCLFSWIRLLPGAVFSPSVGGPGSLRRRTVALPAQTVGCRPGAVEQGRFQTGTLTLPEWGLARWPRLAAGLLGLTRSCCPRAWDGWCAQRRPQKRGDGGLLRADLLGPAR